MLTHSYFGQTHTYHLKNIKHHHGRQRFVLWTLRKLSITSLLS